MPQDTTSRAAEQRAAARARLADITAPVLDELTAEQARQAAIVRRRQAAEQTEMSADIRELLLRLASAPEGTTTRQAEQAMQTELGYEVGVSKSGAWRCLDKLRLQGVVELRGKGRGASWHLAAQPAEEPPAEDVADPEFEHARAVEEIEEAATEEAADLADDYTP